MSEGKQTSLGKALGLLSVIGERDGDRGVGVGDLMAATGLSRPTSYRFLSELQAAGFVTPDPGAPTWHLGPKIIALASVAGSWTALRRRARIEMDAFVEVYGHTVHLGLRDGMEVVYVEKSESGRHLSLSSTIGQRRALNVTALGKCLVAFDAAPDFYKSVMKAGLERRTENSIVDCQEWQAEIEKVRELGLAHDIEECDLGARCVAVPILDGHGHATAAISVSAMMLNSDAVDFDKLGQALRAMAHRIATGSASDD